MHKAHSLSYLTTHFPPCPPRTFEAFYQRNGLNLFFSSLEQEMLYRNWDVEKDGPLETRLMFRDMTLLKRPSIRM